MYEEETAKFHHIWDGRMRDYAANLAKVRGRLSRSSVGAWAAEQELNWSLSWSRSLSCTRRGLLGALRTLVKLFHAATAHAAPPRCTRPPTPDPHAPQATEDLRASHTSQLAAFVEELQKKRPTRARPSRDYLLQREMQDKLAKSQQYSRATKVKTMADELYQVRVREGGVTLREGRRGWTGRGGGAGAGSAGLRGPEGGTGRAVGSGKACEGS